MVQAEKPQRRDANENPWYCLATLYGEQPEGGWDRELADKNRTAWNRWVTRHFSAGQYDELRNKGVAEDDLQPFQDMEKLHFIKDFAARMGHPNAMPPDPVERIDFSTTDFPCPVDFKGFIFLSNANFRSSTGLFNALH
jgi:hypothetical protein